MKTLKFTTQIYKIYNPPSPLNPPNPLSPPSPNPCPYPPNPRFKDSQRNVRLFIEKATY